MSVRARNRDAWGRRFPRTMRLRRHADFERVYQQGRRHFSAHMTFFYLRRDQGQGLRVGFTVSRALGGAIDRNRMKRRLREAIRLGQPRTPAAIDMVIHPKRSLLAADFEVLLAEVGQAFQVIDRVEP